ncbi:MAG TPA: acetyl-CoA hydrolase/transferase C-terminal domain-containing protein [Terriglobia bacterium]|nr:acetyl-CoA hydrolase/transferase C-terminal domain-containing protein [Terriglobia bacterium]
MTWLNQYKQRLCTAEEAVSAVKCGDRIYISGNAAAPRCLLETLARRKDELHNVELVHGLLIGQDPLAQQEMAGHFRHNSLFVGSADREAVNSGRADYIPVFLHEIPGLFYSKLLPLDVTILHATMPDEHGFMSLGTEVLASRAALENSRTVIIQVNDKMPRTLGDSFVHVSAAHKIVEVSETLPTLLKKGYTEIEQRIGEHIGGLVDDGATLQLGIGGIPDAVLVALKDKKNLGIHTEMISDGVKEGIEAGFITGARKTLHSGKVVGTFILGSQALYDFVHNNPSFELHPTNHTNNPLVIAQNEKMVSVNSAIEIDLTGQVCSDSIGPYIYSGFGGQVDFVRGSAMSRGGKPIIALPSTAKEGSFSRIVPFLKPGAGVVTSRADVHYVVTEYGVAYLHGKNLRERSKILISIAHPNFREELERAARDRLILTD